MLSNRFAVAAAVCLACCCTKSRPVEVPAVNPYEMSLSEVAKMLSSVPLQKEHLREVYDAVGSSSGNGYDEEYMMSDLLSAPGSGVGDGPGTKAARAYSNPLRSLISDYLSSRCSTKSGASDAELYLNALSSSDMQIYWPYSEDWDGETFPVITFDPGFGSESNYGYEISYDGDGFKVVDSVFVDEKLAMERPVWVINRNDDSGFTPMEMFIRDIPSKAVTPSSSRAATSDRCLVLRSFRMLRNYDSWFGGASEFRIQIGSVQGFKASTESELKNYYPAVTEFVLVVKRKYLDVDLAVNAILMTDFTNQLDKLAFLVTEDDGGTRTSWKCSATVKVQSKVYDFDLEIPFNEKDDIVWRGQLAASFFQAEDEVTGRFGDVEITFALE